MVGEPWPGPRGEATRGRRAIRCRGVTGPTTSPLPLVAAGFGLLAVALGGCGGSEPVSGEVLEQRLVAVADAVDACFAKTSDARKCTDGKALGRSDEALHLGDGIGEVELTATKPLRYQVVAKAGDDVEFAILVQPIGARKRICKPQGTAPCSKDGVW